MPSLSSSRSSISFTSRRGPLSSAACSCSGATAPGSSPAHADRGISGELASLPRCRRTRAGMKQRRVQPRKRRWHRLDHPAHGAAGSGASHCRNSSSHKGRLSAANASASSSPLNDAAGRRRPFRVLLPMIASALLAFPAGPRRRLRHSPPPMKTVTAFRPDWLTRMQCRLA